MKRAITSVVAAITIALLAPTAWADGPSSAASREVEGTVQSVNTLQHLIVLKDGTELLTSSPALLAQIAPGQRVSVQYVDEYGQKTIQRLEVMAP